MIDQNTQNYTSIHHVADFFLAAVDRSAGDGITNLKIQKLAYYSEAWHLTIFGIPLSGEVFEAWAHGPVAQALYHRFSSYGYNPIPKSAIHQGVDDPDTCAFLQEVWGQYGGIGAKVLEQMTHAELPWIEARGSLGPLERSNEIISPVTMQRFYGQQLTREPEQQKT